MKQILKVRTDTIDGDEDGNEWLVHYVLFENEPEDMGSTWTRTSKYELYEDDGEGNSVFVCEGDSKRRMVSLTLRLGEFIEWGSE